MRQSVSSRSLRAQILLPFALGAAVLVTAVGGSAVFATRRTATIELDRLAVTVRRTFDSTMERQAERVRRDAELLAQRPVLADGIGRRNIVRFSREEIPFAIDNDYAEIAILGPDGEAVYVDGERKLSRDLAAAKLLTPTVLFGIPASAFTVSADGAIVVYGSAPIPNDGGIVGSVLIAHRLRSQDMMAVASPLGAMTIVAPPGVDVAAPAQVADARSYSFQLGGGTTDFPPSTLHVFVSGADVSRGTRVAAAGAGVVGLAFIIVLILLVNSLLNRAVARPLGALGSAIERVRQGVYGGHVEPDGARELREFGDGFNNMSDALHAGAEFREGVMNATTDAILSVDLDGRLTLVNRRACELTGLTADDLLGRPLLALVSYSDAARVGELLATAGHPEHPTRLDTVQLLGRDGAATLVNLSCSLLSDNGRVSGLVVTAEDVTAQMLLEQQLRQSQKLEAVGQLAGGIAHDFNNLMTGIIGYAELMLAERTEAHPDYEPLAVIKRTGEQAAALTRQLLAFSRKQVLQPKVLDLRATVVDSEKLLTRLIGPNVELVTSHERPLGTVKADPGQIEQVIMNLVLNARDAMPNGGTVTIETANVDLDGNEDRQQPVEVTPGEYVRLTVSDTGTGIPPAIMDNLFQPFFTTKEQGRGTGLGLSTVYGIVKQSGGYVFAQNNPDVGASFNVYLPRLSAPLDATAEVRPAGGGSERGSETVLLVDDEDVVRDVARRSLEASGYIVVSAVDGLAALELWAEAEATIDLVITDVAMPRMGGPELVDRLRASRPDLPVIYTSGHMDDALLRKDLFADGILFLQKPFSIDALTRAARRALDGAPVHHVSRYAGAVRIP